MGCCCDNLVSLFSQIPNTNTGVFITMYIDPLFSTHGNIFIQSFTKPFFDNMRFLYSENLATSNYGTRVMNLKNVFDSYRDIFGTLIQYF